MQAIELNIIEPQNNSFFIAPASVSFKGQSKLPDELLETPLYYRWYSSLFEASENRYSMNEVATTSAETLFTHELVMGTHVIAFAVSNVAGESADEFTTIEHGSVTGGAEGNAQCLLHVLKANILLPQDLSTDINHSSVQLQAEAPAQWGRAEDIHTGEAPYIINDDYQAVNRLQYRWVFEPEGEPLDRPVFEFIPTAEDLLFQPMDEDVADTVPTRVDWTVALTTDGVGLYKIKLIVEDSLNENMIEHSEQITVTII